MSDHILNLINYILYRHSHPESQLKVFIVITLCCQVSGDVYAVDDWTVLLVNFNYDGTGDDTFFWAGDAPRPGPQGFIVSDEHAKLVLNQNSLSVLLHYILFY